MLDIKARGGLLSQGFEIPVGSMVNLLFLMGRCLFSALSIFFSVFLFSNSTSLTLSRMDSDYLIYIKLLQYIKGGPVVGFVYWAPDHFLVFFNRLRLQE